MRRVLSILILAFIFFMRHASALDVKVEAEETAYTFKPPNNGSGPLWSYGCSQIARLGDDVYVSQMETGKDVPLLCNTRWRLLHREETGWNAVVEAEGYRQREPCPIVTLSRESIFMSVNDSTQPAGVKYGPCEPALLHFTLNGSAIKPERLLPSWGCETHFTDHSYRGFSADRANERILVFNIDAKTNVQHGCLLSKTGETLATTSISFPIRACYPQTALRGNAAYMLALGDEVEPVKEWREYKFEQTKQTWDYVFRVLYFTSTPDIAKQPFSSPFEIANVSATGGQIGNQDLWISPSGEAYALYVDREVQSPLLRDKFFPGKSVIPSLRLAIIKDGAVVSRQTLVEGSEALQPSCARFHVAKNGSLYAVLYTAGTENANKLIQVFPATDSPQLIPIPLKTPIANFCLASERAGNEPTNTIDILGQTNAETMSYARIQISFP